MNGDGRLVARAVLVVVTLDGRGNARSVPTWVPGDDAARRLDAHAGRLIELRLAV